MRRKIVANLLGIAALIALPIVLVMSGLLDRLNGPRPGGEAARVQTLPQAEAAFRSLPGQVGLLVLKDGAPQVDVDSSRDLAVGTGFEVAVLAALKTQIDDGRHRWDEVVELQPDWRSVLDSVSRDFPDGSPMTISTLASLMMAGGENTAADALIHVVGREAVEGAAPRNRPFLTTREALTLRNPRSGSLLQRYRAGGEAQRRALLADEVALMPLPDVATFPSWPAVLDVEWRFTPRELCASMASVADLPIAQSHPTAARSRGWTSIATKSGVDTGVASAVTVLHARDGATACVASIWNDADGVDQLRFTELYQRVVELVAP